MHLEKKKSNLESDIKNKVNIWFDDEFLVKEINEIIDTMSEYSVKKYLSDDYINQKITAFINNIEQDIITQWEQYSQIEINEHIETIEKKYKEIDSNFYIQEVSSQKYNYPVNNEIIVQEAKKGAITGGKVGVAIAAYSAWLGPAAAHITLVGALGTVAVPLAVAGAVFKGFKYFKDKSSKEKEKEELRQKLLLDKDKFKTKLYPQIIEAINIMDNNILSNAKI